MPFKSEAQRKYLWANEPEIARDWTDTYGSEIQAAQGGRIGYADGEFVDKIYSPEARTLAGNIPEVRKRDSQYAPTLFEEEEGGEWKYPGEVRPGQEYLTSTLQGANTMLDEMEMQKQKLKELANKKIGRAHV